MKKTILSIILTFCMLLPLSACAGGNQTPAPTQTPTAAQTPTGAEETKETKETEGDAVYAPLCLKVEPHIAWKSGSEEASQAYKKLYEEANGEGTSADLLLEYIVEVTPSGSGTRVFSDTFRSETYICTGKSIVQVPGFTLQGVAAWDYDGNGKADLLFTAGVGSGVTNCVAYLFDVTKNEYIKAFNFAYTVRQTLDGSSSENMEYVSYFSCPRTDESGTPYFISKAGKTIRNDRWSIPYAKPVYDGENFSFTFITANDMPHKLLTEEEILPKLSVEYRENPDSTTVGQEPVSAEEQSEYRSFTGKDAQAIYEKVKETAGSTVDACPPNAVAKSFTLDFCYDLDDSDDAFWLIGSCELMLGTDGKTYLRRTTYKDGAKCVASELLPDGAFEEFLTFVS